MFDLIIEILKELTSAWREGAKNVRNIIISSIILVTVGITFTLIGSIVPQIRQITEPIATTFGLIAGVLTIGIFAYRKSLEKTKREEKIEQVEKRVQEHPFETQAAWELARVKLESYLDRNLKQVRSIFWLTVFVMMVGFGLIIFGIYKVYESPDTFKASLISAIAGIVINFIGMTFLILYRSTMNQAKDYVAILERINAVGMSVQILEKIKDDETKLKQQTTADIARQLLELYTERKGKN
jgi:cytochrome c biogenesis protein CcdA